MKPADLPVATAHRLTLLMATSCVRRREHCKQAIVLPFLLDARGYLNFDYGVNGVAVRPLRRVVECWESRI